MTEYRAKTIVIDNKQILSDIRTDGDIEISVACNIYSKVEAGGTLFITVDGVIIHDDVYCKNVVIEGVFLGVRFKKNVHCDTFTTAGGVYVDGHLVVDSWFEFNGTDIRFGFFTYKGLVVESAKDVISRRPVLAPCSCQSSACPFCSPYLNIESSSCTAVGLPIDNCYACGQRKEVQILRGAGAKEKSLCKDCVSQLVVFTEVISDRRVPNNWEIAHMNEEEKSSFAEYGYVTFPERFPDEPFIHVRPESIDGEIQYKEITVFDPQGRYLTEQDELYNKRVLVYNGGPMAWMFEGTFATWSLYAAVIASPVVGPMLAVLGFAASLPVGWKFSKKLTNMLNDKLVLPHELKNRKELIHARRKDEATRQDIHVETI